MGHPDERLCGCDLQRSGRNELLRSGYCMRIGADINTKMRRGRRARAIRGFTIAELIVACAVLAILGSAVVPTVAAYLNRKRITDSLDTLASLAIGINAFRATVLNWPGRLSDLTTNIVAGQSTACTGVAYTLPSRWATSGPYFDQAIPTTGFQLPIGVANDALQRVPNSAATGFLNIVIPGVRFQDAQAMNDIGDGPGDTNQPDRSNTTGLLQWSAPGAGERVTITYGVPVNKFC